MKNAYVDDICTSVDTIDDANRTTNEMDIILAKGGFKIKKWIRSEQENKQQIAPSIDHNSSENNSEERVLGVCWQVHEDTLGFRTKLNFSKKRRKVHTQPDIKPEELEEQMPESLTKQ